MQAQSPLPEARSDATDAPHGAADRTSVLLRSTIYNVVFYINIIVLMILGLPCVVIGRRPTFFMARTWAKTSLWLLDAICGTRVEFRGLHNIPDRGVIVAAKHQSVLETFALIVHIPDFAYILKRELNWIPLFGWYLWGAEQIGINRAAGSSALIQMSTQAQQAIAEKRAIIIFPEGTRRPVGAPPRYKFGVSHLYTSLDAPVVPVAMNTGLFWPRRKFLRYPGVAVIEFLPAIEPGLTKEEFATQLQETIETHTDALVAAALRADPALARNGGPRGDD